MYSLLSNPFTRGLAAGFLKYLNVNFNMPKPLEILYQDAHLVVINKPNGLLVHRSSMANDADEFAVQLLRDQIGQFVYPVHRLDRKTSGVLVFALDKETTRLLQEEMQKKQTVKEYHAIVRGYFPEEIKVDYALTNDRGKVQEAITRFERLKTTEIDLPLGKYSTSRYSLIKAFPETGRMHQIRKHCNHLRHPIIGDRPHGCSKQNRLFKERWNMTTMLLHAKKLVLFHPFSKEKLRIEARFPAEFLRMQATLLLRD
ncbi:MAG: tRNA pseudouridine synthase C (EC [uncultured Aureispira sp.]|uniref:tRNA pseudouridine synthase C n=1 Tax=uncultured Aureispira sp. TaxID=1331704 RepID=A0A6S6UNE0_9BACT|nr:MAG: tRNA pseudouridine synthase C (EC [uncultured Aureispira sp.]